MLSPSALVHYLLGRGLLRPEDVVDGGLMVVDASRRNRNHKVLAPGQTGYFVKQLQDPTPLSLAAFRREAECYRQAEGDATLGQLAEYLPKCHAYDPVRQLLVLELIDGDSLLGTHQRLGRLPIEAVEELGRTLATVHFRPDPMIIEGGGPLFPAATPWILMVDSLGSEKAAASLAVRQLLETIGAFGGFAQALAGLRGGWNATTLIHGDIKFENCLLERTPRRDGTPAIRIVDWEAADLGDPAWDVGAVLQSFLSMWVWSMSGAPGTGGAQLVKQARYQLEDMEPALRAFWTTYAASVAMDSDQADSFLRRCVNYAAVRIIQTAYETAATLPALSPDVATMLQLSLNVLEDPSGALTDLLGLELESR